MQSNIKEMKALALKLFEINAFKFGDFQMKVGINSPVYFDLRVIVGFPEVMRSLSELLVTFIKEKQLKQQHVCGVPYTALPLATLVSVQEGLPMLVRRKEAKTYGTKKLIEGVYKDGDTCLIIEDVVTSGSSILETICDLTNAGIVVTDTVVVVDREQGGGRNITKKGIRMHSLFTLSFLLNALQEVGKIDLETVQSVAKYIATCQINSDGTFINPNTVIDNKLIRMQMPYENRAKFAKSELGNLIFNLMASKKTNLCLAVDLTTTSEILEIAHLCGPYICILKTHVDIIIDFNENFIKQLQELAERHNFLLMEDRKFADIGNTVALQYSKGIFNISDWAHLITAHTLPGRSIIQGLKAGLINSLKNGRRGVFLLAEISTNGNLIDDAYKKASIHIANDEAGTDFVVGIVCQSSDCFENHGLIQLTPGVKLDAGGDSLGQIYNTPEYIIKEKGADIAVVGRGITTSESPEKMAAIYRDRLWSAYLSRIS